ELLLLERGQEAVSGRRGQSRARREIDQSIALVILGEYLEQRHRTQQRLHRAVVLARDGVDARRRAGGSDRCARHGDRIAYLGIVIWQRSSIIGSLCRTSLARTSAPYQVFTASSVPSWLARALPLRR